MIQHPDIVDLGSSYGYPGRDRTTQINECMHLDRCLGLAELGPREQRKTQIDGCRIKGIQWLCKFDSYLFTLIKPLRHADQDVAKVLKDAPISEFVGIGLRRY